MHAHTASGDEHIKEAKQCGLNELIGWWELKENTPYDKITESS